VLPDLRETVAPSYMKLPESLQTATGRAQAHAGVGQVERGTSGIEAKVEQPVKAEAAVTHRRGRHRSFCV